MRSTGLAFLLTVFVIGTYGIRQPRRPKHDKVVACYVASWAAYRQNEGKFVLDDLRPEHCTHLIYAFAGLNATTWQIRSLDSWADVEKSGIGNYRIMTGLRRQYPGLKVTLGIGGWSEGSANYSALASSPASRKIFVASVVEFIRKFDFDGLDLDWEFPGTRDGAPHDKENFVLLVKELKEAFRSSNLLLTAAISANIETINGAYDIPEISKYLDYIHVMAYDYHGAWDAKVLPNAPLKGKDGLAVEDSLKHLLSEGAPAGKLVLGLAMYGRTFVLATKPKSPAESPIGLPSVGTGFPGNYTSEDGFLGYNEICKEVLGATKGWATGWDDYSQTPYAIKDDRVVVYDNPKSIRAKIEYINDMHLAGVMVWSIDTDDFRGSCAELHRHILDPLSGVDFPLMRVINMALGETTEPQVTITTVSPGSSSSAKVSFNFFLTIPIMFTFFRA